MRGRVRRSQQCEGEIGSEILGLLISLWLTYVEREVTWDLRGEKLVYSRKEKNPSYR